MVREPGDDHPDLSGQVAAAHAGGYRPDLADQPLTCHRAPARAAPLSLAGYAETVAYRGDRIGEGSWGSTRRR